MQFYSCPYRAQTSLRRHYPGRCPGLEDNCPFGAHCLRANRSRRVSPRRAPRPPTITLSPRNGCRSEIGTYYDYPRLLRKSRCKYAKPSPAGRVGRGSRSPPSQHKKSGCGAALRTHLQFAYYVFKRYLLNHHLVGLATLAYDIETFLELVALHASHCVDAFNGGVACFNGRDACSHTLDRE